MVKITNVLPRSRAEKCGILSNDILLSINGEEINDVLDYRFYLAEKNVTLKLMRGEKEYETSIKKGTYDDIGLEFETPLMDKKHSCKNGCIFCFIDQNPKGLRESLYFKDDDSRLSFIHGNYITLTNMSDKDIDRIVKMRFSPINISLHTTNPELRVKMMKNKRAGQVLSYLKRIKDARLSMCGQIVLCRGVNDGDELKRALRDLAEYYPEMGSVSIVPAGLTKYRDKLYPLTDFTKEDAIEIINTVNSFGDECKARLGSRIFFVADELYLKAGIPIPEAEYYEGYPQIENGVGMIRSFIDEFEMARTDAVDEEMPKAKRTVSIATGVLSYPMIKELADKIMALVPQIQINVYKIINYFFGESITVSGLLTGKDIFEQLLDKELGEVLFVPSNALKADEDIFLCDMSLDELSKKLNVEIKVSENDGYTLFRDLLNLD